MISSNSIKNFFFSFKSIIFLFYYYNGKGYTILQIVYATQGG